MSEKTNPRREYRRIYRNVLITLLLLAVTPLVALGWFSINRIDSVYDEKISAGLEALTSSKLWIRSLESASHRSARWPSRTAMRNSAIPAD